MGVYTGMTRVLFLSAILVIVSMAAEVRANDPLTVTGCGISKKAYLEKALQVFAEKHGIRHRLSGGGATKGIRLTQLGKVKVGATCRQRLADIGGTLHEAEKDIELIHVGWDALVVITHRDNPRKNITSQNLRDIFDGKITNWQELGGADRPIRVLTRRGTDSGVGYMARLLIFGDADYEFKNKGRVYRSTGPLEKAAMNFEGSIALDGISSAKKVDVALIGIDGVEPTKENVASGRYPFFRPLYLAINKHDDDPMVKAFVDFLLGAEGQKIVSEQGTVNLEEGRGLVEKWRRKTAAMGKHWQESIR